MSITRYQPGKRMSQAVVHGNTVYLAGQVATDYNGTIEKQTGEVLAAIDKLLAEAGSSKSKVLYCQVVLNNIADFAAMNTVYDAWVDQANPPARAAIEARLAHPALKVEIIAVALVISVRRTIRSSSGANNLVAVSSSSLPAWRRRLPGAEISC